MSTNIPSFEEVDKHIQKAKIPTSSAPSKGGAARGAAKGPTATAAAAPNVCEIYKIVRPILLLLTGTPFIPAKWKEAIKAFISALDLFCPQS